MTTRGGKLRLEEIGLELMNCIKSLIGQKHHIPFTQDPEITERDIIEYESRMRTLGLEKFNGPCYVSAVNFYRSQNHKQKHDSIGAIIVYVNETCAYKLFKSLGLNVVDEFDESSLLKSCAETIQLIVNEFLPSLTNFGYKNLVLSEPSAEKNDFIQGVEFDYGEYKLFESSFYLWKEKAIVTSITLGPAK